MKNEATMNMDEIDVSMMSVHDHLAELSAENSGVTENRGPTVTFMFI